MSNSIVNKIFRKNIPFNYVAGSTLFYQYTKNAVYRDWCSLLNVDFNKIKSVRHIPFLPVSFFKTHTVICDDENFETVFESSGTTQMSKSKHYVKHLDVYVESFLKGFKLFYGDVKNWCIIGLLPSYLQQKNSSLIKMVDVLIKESRHKKSGFYLNEFDALHNVLKQLEHQKQKTLLIGVTFALLDFAEQFPMQLSSTQIMETGGMKGRRKEITRDEVHSILKEKFQLKNIHSEYGMTELLSQAYAKENGRFYCPPWMKVFVRDEDDPFKISATGKGALNIIDLANLYSASFIATDDVGRVYKDGSFTVQGRMDNSDIRGCSLMTI